MSTAVLAPSPIRRPVDRAVDRATARAGRPARPVPQSRTAGTSGLRLTRRGRLLVVAVLAVLAFLVLTVGQAALGLFDAEAGSGSSSTDAARTWVVQPGETLWSIAERIEPNSDPRELVARIVSMNDLTDSAVTVGQEIFVPAP